MQFRCPTCKRAPPADSKHFPFCCERCQMIDLGRWFDEGYRLSHPLTPWQRLEMEEDGELKGLNSEEDE